MNVIKTIISKSRVEHKVRSEIYFESNEHTLYVVIKDKRHIALKCPKGFSDCYYQIKSPCKCKNSNF